MSEDTVDRCRRGVVFLCAFSVFFICPPFEQESRAVARKPRDAAAVLFGLKFAL